MTRRLNSKADLKLLKRYMEFSDEYGGYATKELCPHFNLRRGFRLLEKGQVRDTHDLESLSYPLDLYFFDAMNHMGLNLLCPLMDIVGFDVGSVHLGSMHILDLGVCQYLAGPGRETETNIHHVGFNGTAHARNPRN